MRQRLANNTKVQSKNAFAKPYVFVRPATQAHKHLGFYFSMTEGMSFADPIFWLSPALDLTVTSSMPTCALILALTYPKAAVRTVSAMIFFHMFYSGMDNIYTKIAICKFSRTFLNFQGLLAKFKDFQGLEN